MTDLQLPSELQRRLESLARLARLPGLSVAVCGAGRSPMIWAYGHASLPFAAPVDADTLFNIASISKHFTAAAIGTLLSEGGVQLTSTLDEVLSDVPPEWQGCTVGHLLSNTSGIPGYEEGMAFDRPSSVQTALDRMHVRTLLFPPGASWSYSNTNFLLLGRIIETVTGESYAAYLTRQVLRVNGLERARVDDAEAVVPNRAEPYELRADGAWWHAKRMSSDISGFPDGSVLLSAREAVLWSNVLEQGTFAANAFSSRMFEPTVLTDGVRVPYGFAWFVESVDRQPLHWHTGGFGGFVSFVVRVPTAGLTVWVLGNGDNGGSRVQRAIGLAVCEALSPKSTPMGQPEIPDRAPELTKEVEQIVFRGKAPLDRTRFSPSLQRLMETRGDQAILAYAEPPVRAEVVEDSTSDTQRTRRYRFTFPDRIEHVTTIYTANGLIAWLFWL